MNDERETISAAILRLLTMLIVGASLPFGCGLTMSMIVAGYQWGMTVLSPAVWP